MKSGKLLVLAILAAVVVGVALFVQRPRTEVALSSNMAVNRGTAHVLPGKTSEKRGQIDPGMTEDQVRAVLGDPSEKLESRGDVVSARWNYLYADGNLAVRTRGGRVTEIETTFY